MSEDESKYPVYAAGKGPRLLDVHTLNIGHGEIIRGIITSIIVREIADPNITPEQKAALQAALQQPRLLPGLFQAMADHFGFANQDGSINWTALFQLIQTDLPQLIAFIKNFIHPAA